MSPRCLHTSLCIINLTRRNLSSLGARFKESSTTILADVFEAEKRKRARELRKFVVKAKEAPESTYKSFLMNQEVSTPCDVGKHISHHVAISSALCLLTKSDGSSRISSLNEPLNEECEIDFVTFDHEDKELENEVHKAYFRSSSVLLGAVASAAFHHPIKIHEQTANLPDCFFSVHALTSNQGGSWISSKDELAQLSSYAFDKFIHQSTPFEVLRLSLEALKDVEMDLESYADENDSVMLCRVGKHVVPIDGPVIAHAGQIGRFGVVKALQNDANLRLYGMSIPRSSRISSYIWNVVLEHSRKKADE